MEFYETIKSIGEKVSRLIETTNTEEAIKTAFVLPFIGALGYDVFDPTEVIPEFITDYGTKKGEKVDYCIKKDKNPIIIIECKHWKEDLNDHNSQLFRYFTVTDVRFAILTNGRDYRFFTDSEYSNRMDDKPFWEFNISNLSDNDIENLKKYHKDNFDSDKMFRTAVDFKYSKKIKKIMRKEIDEPSDDFVRFFAKKIHSGTVTKKIIEQFRSIVKKSLNNFFEEAEEKLTISEISKSYAKEKQVKREIKQENQSKTSGRYIVIDGEKIPIHFSKDILINTAEWLIRKGDLTKYDCPIFFTKKRNLINTEPIHQDLKKYSQPQILSNGLYIETHANTERLISLSKQLLKKYNYSEDILKIF